MPVPLTPILDNYRGSNETKRKNARERNARAHEILLCLHKMIIEDEDEIQQHMFDDIAIHLKIDREEVENAVPGEGSNGITLRVTDDDRRVLKKMLQQHGRL